VLVRLTAQVRDELATTVEHTTTGAGSEPVRLLERLLAHVVLEGHDPSSYRFDFPIVRFLVQRLVTEDGFDEREARLRAICLLGLELGWSLFEPVVQAATSFEPEERALIDAAVLDTRRRIGTRA
jgi:hypothetical protein